MISTKGRYALRVMLDLAQNSDGSYIPLKDIAERQEISKKYLEIIVKEMVTGGLIAGVSGKGGGYKLVRKPEKYTVGEILELMEGTLSIRRLPGRQWLRVPENGEMRDSSHVERVRRYGPRLLLRKNA